MSLQLERSKQLEYNLAVLKRRDAAITRVLDMAGHVVLYQFNEETKAWDRRNMEGSLFVVERSSEPRYQFVVLNRLSSENVVETVDANFQMELTEQFLLYRNDAQAPPLSLAAAPRCGCSPRQEPVLSV